MNCTGECRVYVAVGGDPEMGNVAVTYREAVEANVARIAALEAELRIEACERKAADAKLYELTRNLDAFAGVSRPYADQIEHLFAEVKELRDQNQRLTKERNDAIRWLDECTHAKNKSDFYTILKTTCAELEADRERLEDLADAVAHRAQNERLCRWLCVEPVDVKVTDPITLKNLICLHTHTYSHRSIKEAQWAAADAKKATKVDYAVHPRYPDLDTREGFWVLWDALREKGYGVCLRTDHSKTSKGLIYKDSIMECLSAKEGKVLDECVADTPQAALFAAAVALMEREGGNG